MKEAVGGTWLFGIVITFIVFFTTYISMSTNYAKSFKVKDEILITIEHYKGVNSSSIERINNYLDEIGYFSSGDCNGYRNDSSIPEYTRSKFSDWMGFNFNEASNRPATSTKDVNYCIRQAVFESGDKMTAHPRSALYQVVVFFSLDWPVIGSLLNVRIEGETSVIHMYTHEAAYSFSS